MNNTLTTSARELDSRKGDGLVTRLLWNPDDDTLTVTVEDLRTEALVVIPVQRELALDAFQHPFAYAA